MRHPILLLVASTFLASPAFAVKDEPAKATEKPAEKAVEKAPVVVPAYSVIKEKSFLKFIATQNSAPVQGAFDDYTADIRFDPEHAEASSIKAEIATGSIRTADEEIAKNLKLADWLDVSNFPKAVFECKKLTRMPSTDSYYGDGTLTLRGKTVPVVINFQMEHFDGDNAVAKGYVTLRRKDFGVGQGQWAKDDPIRNEVRVEFRIAAKKQ